jgi:hypothetical protein
VSTARVDAGGERVVTVEQPAYGVRVVGDQGRGLLSEGAGRAGHRAAERGLQGVAVRHDEVVAGRGDAARGVHVDQHGERRVPVFAGLVAVEAEAFACHERVQRGGVAADPDRGRVRGDHEVRGQSPGGAEGGGQPVERRVP